MIIFARKHQRRAADLEGRLDNAHQRIEQLTADVETARYNERTALQAREAADNRAAALDKRLIELQSANEHACKALTDQADTTPTGGAA